MYEYARTTLGVLVKDPNLGRKAAKTVPNDGHQTMSSGSIDTPSIGGVDPHLVRGDRPQIFFLCQKLGPLGRPVDQTTTSRCNSRLTPLTFCMCLGYRGGKLENSFKVLIKYYTVILGHLWYIKLVKTLNPRLRPHYSKTKPQD